MVEGVRGECDGGRREGDVRIWQGFYLIIQYAS